MTLHSAFCTWQPPSSLAHLSGILLNICNTSDSTKAGSAESRVAK